MEEVKEKSLKEKVDELYSNVDSKDKKKERKKKVRLPRKAKVTKRKSKKGYIGVIRINENGVVSGEKVLVEGSSYKTDDGLFHATEGDEKLMWEGKYPVVFQCSTKINPIDFLGGDNETYGQPYIMTKMMKDNLSGKKKGMGILLWILIGGAALFGLNYITGGSLF